MQRRNLLWKAAVLMFLIAACPIKSKAATLDIKNFGARCDGSDDTATVQSAVNALQSGDTLNVSCMASIGSSGVQINNKSNVTIRGNGLGTGFKAIGVTNFGSHYGFGPSLIKAYNCSSCTIDNFEINVNNLDEAGFLLDTSSNSTVQNLNVHHVGCSSSSCVAAAGIVGDGNSGSSFKNNTVHDTAGHETGNGVRGLWVRDNGTFIASNIVYNAGGSGIACNCKNAEIAFNISHDNFVSGIKLSGAGSPANGNTGVSSIHDNIIYSVSQGITLEQIGGTGGLKIYNNQAYNNRGDVIYANGSPFTNISVNNNIFHDNTGTAIKLLSTASNVIVNSNQLMNNGNAIHVGETGGSYNGLDISKNYILGGGVVFQNSNGTSVNASLSGNSIANLSGWGWTIDGGISGSISQSGNCWASGGNNNISDGRGIISNALSSASCSDPTTGAIVPITSPITTQLAPACPAPGSNAFTGCYYNGKNFETLITSRTDSTVDFSWASSPISGVSADQFSVRWSGNFYFQAGTYTFNATTDDGMKIYIDGALVLDKWFDQPTTAYSVSKTLTAGNHLVTVEFYDNYFGAEAHLSWQLNSAIDTTPPNVSITAPINNSTISGLVTASANATDNTGIVGVQFKINGSDYGPEDTTAPYTVNWVTTDFGNMNHTISAVARDAAGNTTQSPIVNVTVNNSQSSTKFTAGQRVQANVGSGSSLNVRSNSTINSSLVGTQPNGALGTIVSGGLYADGYYWWKVDFDSGADGYVVESFLAPYIVPVADSSIRINAGGAAYTDSAGKTWKADYGYSGGSADTLAAVSNTKDPTLYKDARWSQNNLDYQFTLPNNIYQVTLKFAETYFNSVGQRVFSVDANGQRVLSDFDIVKEAGGTATAIDKSFPVAVTNGTLLLHMSGSVDDPLINAIQIEPSTTGGAVPPPSNISTKFKTGDRVQTNARVNVRALPSTSGKVISKQNAGAKATVLSGGMAANGYYWWYLGFDAGVLGYVAEDYLQLISAAPTAQISTNNLAAVAASTSSNLSIQAQIDLLQKMVQDLVAKLRRASTQ